MRASSDKTSYSACPPNLPCRVGLALILPSQGAPPSRTAVLADPDKPHDEPDEGGGVGEEAQGEARGDEPQDHSEYEQEAEQEKGKA